MLFVCHPKVLQKHYLQFLLGVKMAPRETENNAWGMLWYFLEWSIFVGVSRGFNSFNVLNLILFFKKTEFF